MARKFVRGFPAKEATVPNKPDLKYLDFLYLAAVQAILCTAALYHVAKERSGPLRGGVETVERSVKSVVNPVYQRYQEVPVRLLLLADRKVDSAVGAVEHHVPPTVKTVSAHVYTALCALTAALCDFLNDARASGPSSALKAAGGRYKPVAAELYKDYGPVAEHYAVATWQFLNGLPLFPQVAHLVIPTAAHWAEKYNHAVESGSARGIAFVQYLPEVPVEKIAKVFSGNNNTQREVPAETQPEAKAAQAASPEPEAKAVPTE